MAVECSDQRLEFKPFRLLCHRTLLDSCPKAASNVVSEPHLRAESIEQGINDGQWVLCPENGFSTTATTATTITTDI